VCLFTLNFLVVNRIKLINVKNKENSFLAVGFFSLESEYLSRFVNNNNSIINQQRDLEVLQK